MKKFTLLITLLLFVVCSFAQKITRGPDVGEIYFLGPTTTILQGAIYHSTDFGETAICMDSVSALSNTLVAMTADKTPGSLLFSTMGGGLYYSDSYGNYNTWTLHQGGISNKINSGRNDGEIFNRIGSHSINYGLNFTTHSCQGFFASTKAAEIDNSNDIAYCISYDYEINDTLFFFISYNNYDNLEVKHKFNFHWSNEVFISRENDAGTLFLCNTTLKELYFSDNYGESWTLKNLFTCPNLPIKGITGGRQDGELYLLVEYLQMMGQRRHVYIYHSLDYGETFTIYHPVSIGPDPIYADFIATDTLVEPGDTVQFTDLSNDAETWEWDFENDGTIDSYEQNPIHIYQDTGYYTVKLSITGSAIQDYGIRHDYIHVDNINDIEPISVRDPDFLMYPIPAKEVLNIRIGLKTTGIQLFDLSGKLVKNFCINPILQNSLIELSVTDIPSGVYLLKANSQINEITKKILITK